MQKDSDIVLFGGGKHLLSFFRLPLREPVFQLKHILLAEYYDGKADKMRCYNDVFMYSPRRESWMQVISPGGCGPIAHA